MEPASWGKMVVFGPSMEDFRDARDILVRAGAGIEVKDAKELISQVERILSDPGKAGELGTKGREAILKHAGSAAKNAEILTRLLAEHCGH